MRTMTKADADKLSGEIFKALLDIAERHNLKLKHGGGTYDPLAGSFKPRVEFTLRETESGNSQEQITFERYAPMYGLLPTDYKTVVKLNGRQYSLTSIKPSARRFSIGCTDIVTLQVMFFPAPSIRKALGRPVAGLQEVAL